MNAKQFLLIGGIIALIIGLLGFFHVLGPTSSASIFGPNWWFDTGECWAYTIIGLIGIIASLSLGHSIQQALVMLIGILALLLAIYNFFSTNLLGSNLENPADLIFNLVIGIWALWAAMQQPPASDTH